jgi:signal-transduction protein with cAMP-binding, CBS, and nucleotidyltransferase domain
MPVFECCRTAVVTASPEASVREVARLMSESNVGSVVIMTDDCCPIGIVTDRDLVTRVMAPDRNPKTTKIREVMTTDLVVVEENTGLYEALQCVRDKGIRRLPIVDGDGKLVGIITMDDIIRLLGQELQCMGEVIREKASPAA